MYSGLVYKYTSPSGKVYIGQTTRNLSNRGGADGERYRKSTAFYIAIKKYGFKNLEATILEKVYSKDRALLVQKLDTLEKKYIGEYCSSSSKYGYNCTDGGGNGIHNKEARIRCGLPNKGKVNSAVTRLKMSQTWKQKYQNGYINSAIGKPSWNKGIKIRPLSLIRRTHTRYHVNTSIVREDCVLCFSK